MTRLDDFYRDFAAVLRTDPQGADVLDSALLPESSASVQVADVLSSEASISISRKLGADAYNMQRREEVGPPRQLEGPMLLFHDLKLAFARILAGLAQDSVEYNTVSSLFKFAIDLFVREAHRLGLILSRESLDSDFADGDDYFFRISQGFQAIRTEVQEWNGETFWVTAANGPLFMSASNKAPVDPRQTAAAGSVHTARLLPHIARAPESTLGFVSPLNPRFPQPNYPPTDLLSRFVHPNGHNTLAPVWITGQDGYSTFAPTLDSSGAVIGEQDAANVWVERASERPRPKFSYASLAPPAAGDTTARSVTEPLAPSSHAGSVQEPARKLSEQYGQPPKVESPESSETARDLQSAGESVDEDSEAVEVNDVDIDALLHWTPHNFVDDDELEAAEKGSELELVSRLLLELQYLQRQRLSTPGVELEVGDSERHIALKTQNVLARLVEGAKSDSIDLRIDTRLPVLMRNYAGSLPAATDPAMHAPFPPPQQPQRLQGLDSGLGYRPAGPGRPRGPRR